MQYLIAYDIAHPKRLRRVCRTLEGCATRLQFSVFLFPGGTRSLLLLWEILLRQINPAEDRISAYPIDARAQAEALHAGACFSSDSAEPLIIIA